MKTYSAVANIQKNRLYITVKGTLNANDMSKLYTDIRFGVADLKPGFDVVNDMSECSVGSLSGIPILKKIMHYLITNKAGRVVRIIDESKVIFQQLLNLMGKLQGYTAIQASSMEEAERVLSEFGVRDGMRVNLHNQTIKYLIGDKEGHGQIVDFSMSGCAFRGANITPLLGEILTFSIPFEKHEDLLRVFEGEARIVRAEDDDFAIKFEGLTTDSKERLWKRLVHETTLESD